MQDHKERIKYNMKKAIPTGCSFALRITAILLFLGMVWLLFLAPKPKYNYDIEDYQSLQTYYAPLRALEELGEYESVEYQHYDEDFDEQSYILRVSYSLGNYEREKQQIEARYSFESEPYYDYLAGEHGGTAYKVPCFFLDGYYFRICKFERTDTTYYMYPKFLGFIGVSDEECKLAYIYHHNVGLDFIRETYADFLVSTCKWGNWNDKRDK